MQNVVTLAADDEITFPTAEIMRWFYSSIYSGREYNREYVYKMNYDDKEVRGFLYYKTFSRP